MSCTLSRIGICCFFFSGGFSMSRFSMVMFVSMVFAMLGSLYMSEPGAAAQAKSNPNRLEGLVIVEDRIPGSPDLETTYRISVTAFSMRDKKVMRMSKPFTLKPGLNEAFSYAFPASQFPPTGGPGPTGMVSATIEVERKYGSSWVTDNWRGADLAVGFPASNIFPSTELVPAILTISTGSVSPPRQKIAKGAQGVRLLDVEVKANDARDLFENILVVDVALSRSGNFGFTGFRLKNGGALLSETTQMEMLSPKRGRLTFYLTDLTARNTAETLSVEGDVSYAAVSGAHYTFSVKASGVSAGVAFGGGGLIPVTVTGKARSRTTTIL